ncbi:MAG: hypothetical protein HY854_20975 [Burkholderiales bacterium]|nr:hypothetical protein [Burkholderiales bacterium]
MIHHPTHWIAVGLAALLAVIAFEAAGQMSMGSAAMYEGRPYIAGAQGGLGAQAGVAQGGIGLQGSEATGMNLRKPRIIREAEQEEVAVAMFDDNDRILPKRVEPDTTPMEARQMARAAR